MDKNIIKNRYDSLQERVALACQRCGRNPSELRTIVVTKTHPVETAQAVIDAGIKDIAENRVQEIEAKMPHLKGDFNMHLIGHLQTNKVNKVVPLVSWIQSVDSVRLVEKIENSAKDVQSKIKVLVQVKTSEEETKSGCNEQECLEIAQRISQSKCLEFCGLMTIGPLDATEAVTRNAFAGLRTLAEQCRELTPHIELSMGMSSDFEWAIAEGSTMIRVGTLLLGQREYPVNPVS